MLVSWVLKLDKGHDSDRRWIGCTFELIQIQSTFELQVNPSVLELVLWGPNAKAAPAAAGATQTVPFNEYRPEHMETGHASQCLFL